MEVNRIKESQTTLERIHRAAKAEFLEKGYKDASLRKMCIRDSHLSVSVWIVNQQGQYLLSQRHPKKQYPLYWECTGGSVPVSYTHLDVYKRQKFIWMEAMKIKCGGFTRNRQMIPFWLMPSL